MDKTNRWWLDPVFVIGIAFFFFGGPLNYLSSSPKIFYLGALGICILVFYGTHQLVSRIEGSKGPKTEEPQAKIATPPPTVSIPTPVATHEAPSRKPATSTAEPKRREPIEPPKPPASSDKVRGTPPEPEKTTIPPPHVWKLTQKEIDLLASRLLPQARAAANDLIRVYGGILDGGGEAGRLASDLRDAFDKAGWRFRVSQVSGLAPKGIVIQIKTPDSDPPGLNELKTFLIGIGIEPQIRIDESLQTDGFRIIVGINPN